jgi:hypothetical protein
MHIKKAKTHIIKFSLSFEVKTKNQKQLTEYLQKLLYLDRYWYFRDFMFYDK